MDRPLPDRMRALRFTGPRALELVRVDVPSPGPTQVLVEIEGCGLCSSNLPMWAGRPWFSYPTAPGEPGHEGWGRVAAVGGAVHGVHIGDRVAALSYRALAEFDLAEASAVVRLPAALDGQALPGEPLGCAMNIFRRSDVRRGHKVAVIGVGFIGAVVTQLAARAGAEVLALSRRPFARELAGRMGARHVVAMDEEDDDVLVQAVMTWTGGHGCDRVIEAIGLQRPLDLAGRMTRVRGRLIIAGFHQDGPRQVDMQLWNWRGLDVINAHERSPAAYVDGVRAAIDAVAGGALDPTPLYTHRFPLERAADAFLALEERPAGFLKAQVLA